MQKDVIISLLGLGLLGNIHGQFVDCRCSSSSKHIAQGEWKCRIRDVICRSFSSTKCSSGNGHNGDGFLWSFLPPAAMLLICMPLDNKFIRTGLINHGQFLWSSLYVCSFLIYDCFAASFRFIITMDGKGVELRLLAQTFKTDSENAALKAINHVSKCWKAWV